MTILATPDNQYIKDTIFVRFIEKFGGIMPIHTGYFVAGGIFPRLYHNAPIRDVDLFATSNASFAEVQNLLLNTTGLQYLEDESHGNLAKFEGPNGEYQIDLVNSPRRQTRNAYSLVEKFDFTISRVFMERTAAGFNINSVSPDDFKDIAEHRLTFTGKLLFGTQRNNTLTRMLKYTKLGYKITEEHYVAIGEAIHTLLQKGIDRGAIGPEEIGGNRYY